LATDNAYHDARPELAYASDVLHPDQQWGLNPAQKGLNESWVERNLAIVHA
jgi:uncharacterized protein (DUF1501 family)